MRINQAGHHALQLIAALLHCCPFLKARCSSIDNLEASWTKAEDSSKPDLHSHPMNEEADKASRAIPLVQYGHGGAFSKSASFQPVNFSALLGRLSTWTSKFVVSCFVKRSETKAPIATGTLDEIWVVLRLSFEATFSGKHHLKDFGGGDWPRGPYDVWQGRCSTRVASMLSSLTGSLETRPCIRRG